MDTPGLSPAEILSVIQHSAATSRTLATFDSLIVDWAGNEEGLHDEYVELRESFPESRRLPEKWDAYGASQYIAGEVFSRGTLIMRAIGIFGENLAPAGRTLLSSFLEKPWRYAVFTVERMEADGLFTVWDDCSDGELLLQSRSLKTLLAEGSSTFIALIFWNGSCHQTWGLLHGFKGFEPFDFEFFAEMLNSRLYHSKGLKACIKKSPVPFFLLDLAAEVPPIAHGRERVVLMAHPLPAPGFDPDQLKESQFTRETREGVTLLCLKDEKPPFDSARIYYESETSVMTVYASGEKNYTRLRQILAPRWEIPEEPFWIVTMNMATAVSMILDAPLPWMELEEMFAPQPDHGELEPMNAFMDEVSDLRNKGLDVPVDELAKKHGVAKESAREVLKHILNAEKRMEMPLEGGIPGFKPPSPDGRMKMKGLVAGSRFFVFNDNAAARALFPHGPGLEKLALSVGLESPSLKDLPALLDDLTGTYWEVSASPIAPYTLYLLHEAGGDWRPPEMYAAEILRIFWQVLLPNKGKKRIQAFIEDYAVYCAEILLPLSLVEIGKDGQRVFIRRTRLLDEWLSLAR